MADKGDSEHIKVMGIMREGMNNPEVMKAWVEKVQKEFDALPEDK